MRNGRDVTDEQLEARLRSQPELDPPVHLVFKVMEAISDEEAARDASSAGLRTRTVPLWQATLTAAALVAAVFWAGIRFLPAWLGQVGRMAHLAVEALRFVGEAGVGFIAACWAGLARAMVLAKVSGQVLRTAAEAAAMEYGLALAVAAAGVVALQVLLLTAMARRPRTS